MGFFGELKQDLSQVAGDELKREQADAEAERILADAELAGLDEAELASARLSSVESVPEDDNDDVAALLKDLVAGLGSEDEAAADSIDHSSDISDDINSILAGLSMDIPSEDKASGDINEAFDLARASLRKAEEKAEEETADKASVAGEAAAEAVAEAEDTAGKVAGIEDSVAGMIADPEEKTAETVAGAECEVSETVTETEEIIAETVAETEETIAETVAGAGDAVSEAFTDAEGSAVEAVAGNEGTASEAVEKVEVAAAGSSTEEEIQAADKAVPKGVFKMEEGTFSEETSVITEGMVINGNIESAGNLDIRGKVNGDVTVRGKLNVTGCIAGNSTAKEIYAENARIIGNVNSESSVKIGAGTVVVGNIYAFGAAIAGAVKGDIDVHGPVILDSSAIVKGNIRSKSVQINNGAALEGVCSQAYAEVSPTAFFDDFKTEGSD
ncbi:MAG: polymer-forming cytoskeletal protein [Lachnospiraceae bacterium]|nr:polymer-forming cytoskeletal protein [Lachnospiraceae bacterium]